MPQVVPFVMGAFGVGASTALGASAAWGLGASFAATTLGSITLQLTASVALSALSRAMAGSPPAVGMRTEQTLNGGVNPEAFILGRYATGGALAAPRMSHGQSGKTPNAFLTMVVEIAGMPGHELEALILNGERVEITDNIETNQGYGNGLSGRYWHDAWIRYHDGTQTAADSMLLAKYPAPHVRPWSADMIGRGICYAVMTFRYERELFQSWPEVRFEVLGIPLLDPRTGLTVRTENPMVMIWNILRGITLASGLVWGGNVPAADLPQDAWFAAMDACDVRVSDGKGGTEPLYRAGVEVLAEDEPFAVIDELLKACAGALSEQGGVWTPRVGGPGLPVMTITDDDLLTDAPDDLTPFPAPSEIYNAIEATYPDPEALWEVRDAPAIVNPDWEAQDGGRRLTVSMSFPAVPYPVQVQRLMVAYIKDHRRLVRHAITLPPDAVPLQPLDVIVWSSEANGYAAKQFEVCETTRQLLTGRVQVILREVDPTDWGVPGGLVRPSVPNLTPQLPEAQAVPGWSVQPHAVTDAASNQRRPALRLSWDAEAADDARGIRWAIRLGGDAGDGTESALHDARAGEAVIDNLLPATSYEVRARFVVDRATLWSDWIGAVTPDLRLSPLDLQTTLAADLAELHDWIDGDRLGRLEGDIIPAIEDRVAAANDRAEANALAIQATADQLAAETLARVEGAKLSADRWRSERDRLRETLAQVVELAARDHAAREEIRRTLSAELGSMGASFSEQIVTLADANQAAAIRLVELEAASGDLSASIQLADIARVEGDNALAALIAQISVGSAVQFDHASIWYWDAAPEGWTGSPSDPEVAGGWLLPAAGSDIVSPAELAINGLAYKQIRARLRRSGAPLWQGVIWWAGVGEVWDASRSLTVSEPLWDADEAILTVNLPWAGVIDRVRLELATVTAGNTIALDWLAIGRPAPGASSADLLAERQARIDADGALASDLLDLEARVIDAEGELEGQATALEGLEARVELTEGGITASAQRISNLETGLEDAEGQVAGLAGALDTLSSEAMREDGSQVYQAQALRSLRSQMRALAAEALEGMSQAHRDAMIARDYLATAAQTLGSRIDLTEGQLSIVSEAVTILQSAIPDLATAQAMQALRTIVEDNGSTLAATSEAITALESVINDPTSGLASKLAASALSSYYTKTETNGAISSATASATQALKSSLEGAGGSIKAAQDAAQAASELAGGKGKVIVQSSAPAAADRLAQNLWIDTTGNANTPKRWSGSAWVAVTDKVATDAAAAAANAIAVANTKLDASVINDYFTKTETNGAIATATASATQALKSSLEGTGGSIKAAQDAAQAASTLAGGKGKVIVQSGAPATADRLAQNLWIDTTGNANTPKRWSGSAWVAVTDKVATDAASAAANALAVANTKLNASAINGYYTKTETNGAISTATASATQALKSSLEGAGGSIKAAQDAAQAASTLAGGKGKVIVQSGAPATADRLAQNLWIDTTGNANTPKRWSGSAWVAVTDKVATDAAAAAANALAVANTKASATAVSDLTTRVTDTEGDLDALADLLQSLETTVGRMSASGRIRMTTEANASGASSTVGIKATATAGEANSARSAAIFLEATTDGKSRVLIEAAQFAVMNGTNRAAPFIVDGNRVYIDAAMIRDLTSDQIRAGTIRADRIEAQGITRQGIAGSGPDYVLNNSATWTRVAGFTLNMPYASYIQGTLSCRWTEAPSAFPANFEMRLTINGAVRISMPRTVLILDDNHFYFAPFTDQALPAGPVTVAFEIRNAGGKGVMHSNLAAVAAMR